MLSLEGLRIKRDEFVLAADLTIEQGAQVAVIGPSGAGKSTLLEIIAGFVTPCAGRITWDGRELAPCLPGDRPIAMVFQENNLFPHLDALANAALGLRVKGRLTHDEIDRTRAALARVGLAGFEKRRPADLSGGQRSRVALARIILQDKPILLLDEPFAALGPALKAEMVDLVSEVATEQGATMLMITHSPEDARRLGGHTIVVAEGLAHPPRPTASLLDDPPEDLRAYLG